MKQKIKKIRNLLINKPFRSTAAYWEDRYTDGGNSGYGSYNELAEYKARVINDFVQNQNIKSVLEFGCGDGNQLEYAKYPEYTGFDISERAVEICKELFRYDRTKSFMHLSQYKKEKAELVLSLDVIFHLIEDTLFEEYMTNLFTSSTRYVLVYSSNTDENSNNKEKHVRHRKFTDWIDSNYSSWELSKKIPNIFSDSIEDNRSPRSFSDFYIYRNKAGA